MSEVRRSRSFSWDPAPAAPLPRTALITRGHARPGQIAPGPRCQFGGRRRLAASGGSPSRRRSGRATMTASFPPAGGKGCPPYDVRQLPLSWLLQSPAGCHRRLPTPPWSRSRGPGRVAVLPASARRLAEASVSPHTRRAYVGALRRLGGREHRRCVRGRVPGRAVRHGPRGLERVDGVAAARIRAKLAGRPDPAGPASGRVLAGFRRRSTDQGCGQAAPCSAANMAAIVATVERPRSARTACSSPSAAARRTPAARRPTCATSRASWPAPVRTLRSVAATSPRPSASSARSEEPTPPRRLTGPQSRRRRRRLPAAQAGA